MKQNPDSGEKKLNWSLISSVLFTLILSMIGYFIQQNENRIIKLEAWREEHEKMSRNDSVVLSSQLATIQAKLDFLIKANETSIKK